MRLPAAHLPVRPVRHWSFVIGHWSFRALGAAALLPALAFAQADLPGPDGRLYPDFRRAGANPGPAPALVVRIADHGGLPDDGLDDTAALRAAIAAASAAPEGAIVQLDAGAYVLSEPLCITADRLWIRGAGKDRTTVEFTYGLEPGQIRFVGLAEGQRVPLDTSIEVHAYPGPGDSTYPDQAPPGMLKLLTLSAGGKVVASRKQNEGGPFNLALPLWRITTAAGPLGLTARVEYTDGTHAETALTVEVEPRYLPDGQRRLARYEAAFTFIGDEWTHRSWYRWPLAADALRGTQRLSVARGEDYPRAKDLPFIRHAETPPAAARALRPGDVVSVSAFPTPEWKAATGNKPDFTRSNVARVAAIEGDDILLDRPLRIDFRVAERARLDAAFPLRGSGVEGFTLRQTRRLWTHGILFQNTTDCFARDIRVLKAGRNPIALESSSQCEIRDSEFDDGWYQIGGGTSYLGVGTSFDCLIDNVRTTRLRHAPVVNWSSAGNVFTRSTFQQSDANWHSGWCHENLVEACEIDAGKGSGSYGYGIYTSQPQTAHGATGPKNVFWGNLINSPQTGVFIGGAIDDTVLAYNRFIVRKGPAIEARPHSRGTVVLGNDFVIAQPREPLVKSDATATGWTLVGNRVFGGNGQLASPDSAAPATASDNTFHPIHEAATTPRPVPPAVSLRDWQREHHPLPR